MAAFWVYTLLRFGIFFVLWAIIWLLGVGVLLAGVIAVVLSIPLSIVLLSRPRTALGRVIEERANYHAARKAELDAQLQGSDPIPADGERGGQYGDETETH